MEGGSGCYYSSSSNNWDLHGGSGCYYSSNSNNWDLHAVVRFACGGGRVPPRPSADDPFSSFLPPPAPAVTDGELPDAAWQPLPDLPGGADPAVVDELFKALFAPSSLPPPHPQQQPPEAATKEGTTAQLQQPAAHAPPAMPQPTGRQASSGDGLKSKRKKKQVKRVLQQVPADCVSADPWAWRKYGQKPIKGSPYPRGYYRCSSDKECKARKMVERCRTDPDTFVLIYTGDHSHPVPIHRNSLAGTSRNKQPLSTEPAAAGSQQAPVAAATEAAAAAAWPSPAASTSAGLSPMTTPRSPSLEYGQDEDFEEAGAGLLAEDVEMAGEEDTLLFLNPDEPAMDVGGRSAVDSGAGTAPIMNIVEETFVVTPWITAAGDAIAAAAALGLWS